MVRNTNKLQLNLDAFWKKHTTSQITEDYANIIFGEYAETQDPDVLDEIGLLHISWLMENKYFKDNLPDGPIDKMLQGMGKKMHVEKKELQKKYGSKKYRIKLRDEFQKFHQQILGESSSKNILLNKNGIHHFSYLMYDIFRKIAQKVPKKYHTEKSEFAPIISLILSNLTLEYKGEL